MKSFGIWVPNRSAFRGSDRFTATVSIRQRQRVSVWRRQIAVATAHCLWLARTCALRPCSAHPLTIYNTKG